MNHSFLLVELKKASPSSLQKIPPVTPPVTAPPVTCKTWDDARQREKIIGVQRDIYEGAQRAPEGPLSGPALSLGRWGLRRLFTYWEVEVDRPCVGSGVWSEGGPGEPAVEGGRDSRTVWYLPTYTWP